MRKTLLLLPLFLLASCAPGAETSSSPSPLPSSPSETLPLGEREQIADFLSRLGELPREVTAISYAGSVTTGFNLSISPIEISGAQEGVTAIYPSSAVGKLRHTAGVETIEGESPTRFVEQCYVQGSTFFSLRRDEGASEDYGESSPYDPAVHDAYFDLSLYGELSSILVSYAAFLDQEGVETSAALPVLQGDGVYELACEVTLFTFEGYPDQKVSYAYSFAVENGAVASMRGEAQKRALPRREGARIAI